MDDSSSNDEVFVMDDVKAVLGEASKTKKRKRPRDYTDQDSISNDSYDSDYSSSTMQEGFHFTHFDRVLTAYDMKQRKKSLKRRRMERLSEAMIDDSSSSSSNASMRTIPERRIVEHYQNLHDRPSSSNQPSLALRNAEQGEAASWLLVSSIEGGWTYRKVKRLFFLKYSVKSIISKCRPIGIPVNRRCTFHAGIKFDSRSELRKVVLDLMRRKMHQKFNFTSLYEKIAFLDQDAVNEVNSYCNCKKRKYNH